MANNKLLDDAFLIYASNVIGDSTTGLKGTQISKFFVAKSVEYNVHIPYTSPPFIDKKESFVSKRNVICENLRKFNGEQQISIIIEMCEMLGDSQDILLLKDRLYLRFPEFAPNQKNLIHNQAAEQAIDGLTSSGKYVKSKICFDNALVKIKEGRDTRNALDDLRLSLELLLKEVLNNNKSLENQKSIIGIYCSENKVNKECVNLLQTLIDYYAKYQNEHIKHNDDVNEKEIQLILNLTATFINFILNIKGV